ncbi:MAG: caspase family protein [Planctomycetota bacterium]
MSKYACIGLTFLVSYVSSVAAQSDGSGNSWALLVSVERYDKAPSLRYTSNDVLEISDALTQRGLYDARNLVTVYDRADDKQLLPTRDNMRREIAAFLSRPKAGDSVVVYFSGHGFRDESNTLFLAPSDCDPANPAATGIPASWLREQLASCAADFKLLVLDACHAGNEKGDDRDRVRSDELGDVFRGLEGVATIASSTGDQKSLMWDEKRQSLFSYWLVQALKGHADGNNDGIVSFSEVYPYVYGQVSRTARVRFRRKQQPVRIIRSGTLGDPAINSLRPQTLKRVLTDTAEQIAWALEFDELEAVGVLEFAGRSNNTELLGGDFGLLGSYCAEELNRQLMNLGVGQFKVVDRRRLHEALSEQRFRLADLASTKSLESLADSVGDMPALVRGAFLNRSGEIININTEVVQTGGLSQSTMAGGVAALNESEWAMIGKSSVVTDRRPRTDEQTGQFLTTSATVVRNMEENADQSNPVLSEDFPFRVRVMVNNRERKPVQRGNDLIVTLTEGEVYSVWIDYRDVGPKADDTVFMRLLVDGLNTMPEKLSTKGVQTMEWGKRVNLSEARHWVLDPSKRRTWAIKGFYTGVGTGSDTYREFTVVDSQKSLAARQQFTENIGLITAAFYEREGGQRAVGTDAGTEREEQVGLYKKGGKVGNLLGVIHIRYVSPEALR